MLASVRLCLCRHAGHTWIWSGGAEKTGVAGVGVTNCTGGGSAFCAGGGTGSGAA